MKARVLDFAPERGLGTLELESGERVTFDATVSNTCFITTGVVVEAEVGIGRTGQPRVTLVRFPLRSQARVLLGAALAHFVRNGLLGDADEAWAAAALSRAGLDPVAVDSAGASTLLERYYGEGMTARAARDRVLLVAPNSMTSEHAFAVFAAMCGLAETRPAGCGSGYLELAGDDGPESIDTDGTLDPLAEWFSEELVRRGRREQLFSLGGGAMECFVLRERIVADPAALPLFDFE